MLRALAAASLLALCAGSAAGCGASHRATARTHGLRRAAYRDARLLADPHPQRVHVQEGVAPAYGSRRIDVIELWGRLTCSLRQRHRCPFMCLAGRRRSMARRRARSAAASRESSSIRGRISS